MLAQNDVNNEIPNEGDGELEAAFQGTDDSAADSQQSTANQPQDSQQQAAQQPVWDGSQWTLKYRDKDVIPKSREELINLAQRGFGYSQAMERLNREKQELSGRARQYQQYEQLDQMLKSNPQLAQRILQATAEFHAGQGQQPAGGDQQAQVSPEIMSRLDRIEHEFKKRQQTDEDMALDREVQAIRTRYPNHPWTEDNGSGTFEHQLLQFAVDNRINNLDHAYRAMMWDSMQTNVKADTLKQQQQQRVAANKQGIVQAGGPPANPAPKQGFNPELGYNDLASQMVNELRG
jgi:hypothetical protein